VGVPHTSNAASTRRASDERRTNVTLLAAQGPSRHRSAGRTQDLPTPRFERKTVSASIRPAGAHTGIDQRSVLLPSLHSSYAIGTGTPGLVTEGSSSAHGVVLTEGRRQTSTLIFCSPCRHKETATPIGGPHEAARRAATRAPPCWCRMRQHAEGYDWLCCEQCSWIFFAERIELEDEARPTVLREQKTF
jgi:hypothetical protein